MGTTGGYKVFSGNANTALTKEICTELNIPVNTIGPILSRARKRLRKGVTNPPPVHRAPQPKPQAGE